jgi:hypothetical protein
MKSNTVAIKKVPEAPPPETLAQNKFGVCSEHFNLAIF